MKKTAKFVLFIAVICSAFSAVRAAQTLAPDALVRDLYKMHAEDFKGGKDRLLNGKSRKFLDQYFDKNLAGLMWKDLTTHKDEVGVLDFDPLYNAQDADIKKLIVGQPKIEGDKATVVVTFENFKRKNTLKYLLVRQNSAWKIADIKYSDGSGLLKDFKEDAQNNDKSEDRFFAGTYRVGATTCTVKPIKMAFEIKWAKGSDSMVFYFDGDASAKRYTYSSEKNGRGRDIFVFDDDRIETGKFIRGSDGKEMAVSKVD